MPNIKFSYLYRDGGNYKKYRFLIFANPTNFDLDYLTSLIQSKLIDGSWFYVNEWKLPDLHFDTWDNDLDHTFHEFENIVYTDEGPNTPLNLAEFVLAIEQTDWYTKIYSKR